MRSSIVLTFIPYWLIFIKDVEFGGVEVMAFVVAVARDTPF